jgi:hypothetical protein
LLKIPVDVGNFICCLDEDERVQFIATIIKVTAGQYGDSPEHIAELAIRELEIIGWP